MGGNRRYPHHAGRLAQERELREARSRGPLQSLTDEQLMIGSRVVSIAPDNTPLWARAWLRFGEADVRATVRVLRWTSDAVGLAVDVDGQVLRCWVWQGAVTRIASQDAEW